MILTVSKLNNFLKAMLENEPLLKKLWVEGEVSNYNEARNTAYFVLKDEYSQIDCVCFGANTIFKKTVFKNGDLVRLKGNVDFYVKGGKVSFVVSDFECVDQKGQGYKNFFLLKEKLQERGVFDATNKIPLPHYVSKIGVVTSSTGAVIEDIKTVAKRRNPYCDITVYSAAVQGENAANEIVKGIEYLDRTDVDVIIVARGGGAFEDMAAFNDERVVMAVFNCFKPIISAVGHETDFCLSDMAADCRAATPSAAAEIAVFNLAEENARLLKNVHRLCASLATKQRSQHFRFVSQIKRIDKAVSARIEAEYNRIADNVQSLSQAVDVKLLISKTNLTALNSRLASCDTKQILKKGYAIPLRNGKTVKLEQINTGDNISFQFDKGSIETLVTKKEHNE